MRTKRKQTRVEGLSPEIAVALKPDFTGEQIPVGFVTRGDVTAENECTYKGGEIECY
jgi:hypothetical protein